MLIRIITALIFLSVSSLSMAELTIQVNKGKDDPVPIAIVPFGWQSGLTVAEDIASIVESDLHRSGQFAPLSRSDMLGRPRNATEVYYRDWKSLGVDYVVVGTLSQEVTGTITANYELLDVNTCLLYTSDAADE